jgi:hypothetical protein
VLSLLSAGRFASIYTLNKTSTHPLLSAMDLGAWVVFQIEPDVAEHTSITVWLIERSLKGSI